MATPSPARTALIAVVASLVTSLVVGGATIAFANHQWSDVATGNSFHADVGAFTAAGCGQGYGDGTFRPTEPVLRQQAARFLRACGTRIANEDDEDLTTVPDGTGGVTLNSEGITAGAQAGDGGYVLAIATIELSTSSTSAADFPCTVLTNLRSPTTGHTGVGNTESFGVLFDAPSDALTQVETVTLTEMWEVAPGETITGRTSAVEFGCDAEVEAEGDLTLLYVPFPGNA